MKIWKKIMVVVMGTVLVALLFGCGSKEESTSNEIQEYTVSRGDISLVITAAGNLDLTAVVAGAAEGEIAGVWFSGVLPHHHAR